MTRIERKLLIYLGFVLIVLIILGVMIYLGVQAMSVAGNWVTQTLAVENSILRLNGALKEDDLNLKAYLRTLNQKYLDDFIRSKSETQAELSQLEALTADHARQNQRIPVLRQAVEERWRSYDQAIAERESQPADLVLLRLDTGKSGALTEQIQNLLDVMQSEESNLYKERLRTQNARAQLAAIITVTAILIAIAMLILIGLQMRREIRKQTVGERRLMESRQQLQLSLAAGKAGLWSWDLKTDRLNWSEEHYSVFGLKPDSVPPTYKLWFEFIHPDDRDWVEQDLRAAIDEKSDFQADYRIIHRDGSVHWVLTNSQMLTDSEGQAARLTGITIDVTENKLAEEALYESEERFRQIAENVDAVLWMMDARNEEPIFISSGLERLWGINPERLVQNRMFWTEYIHPADRARTGEMILKESPTGEYDQEYRIVTPGGEERWVRDRSFPIHDQAGRVRRIVGFAVDVTDRKRAEMERERLLRLEGDARRAAELNEQRFRQMMEAFPNIGWVCDVQGDAEFFNHRWYEYTGLTVEASLGRQWQDIIHPEDQDAVRSEWQTALTNGTEFETEFRLHRPADESWRWFLARVQPLRDERNRIVRWLGAATDIDEQKKSEAVRAALLMREKEARAQAETANRMKDEFLAVVSHELRSPLNAMLGWARVLRSEGVDQETHDHAIRVIEQSAEMQSRLIEDLLDSARIVSGKLKIESRPVNLIPVITSAIDTVRLTADSKGVEIQTDLDPEAGIVTGDAERLQQVIWNLLANAVKFTPKGGLVEVYLIRNDPHVTVTVRDTGRGIPAEQLPYVFDRFRQGDSSSTRRAGGLGLGLALVKDLVELHDGTITVESEGDNRGATFIVCLPMRAISTAAPAADIPEQPKSDVLQFSPVLHGLHILTVDDEVEARDLVATLLRRYGATVTSVASAAEVMQLLEQCEGPEKFDLLVSDIGMPDENGYSLIRRIRKLPDNISQIPAIALTAFGSAEGRINALEAGFQMHVPKPVEPTELMMVIASLAGRSVKVSEG